MVGWLVGWLVDPLDSLPFSFCAVFIALLFVRNGVGRRREERKKAVFPFYSVLTKT